ncbi:DUF1972 domain-containing protein [Saccharicrinis aurantiacus]|uniref:DUF1972 domain-containing protein n=1 Tax=Saccharicrinis aurantiacus TaxID=1849719 RepID=UPI002490E9D8|nr:DUF1972 domain-containing protein [Saccharicrinis aurantiacus]
MKKKRVHIIGTHGVPAKYGGFETLSDYLCQYLGSDFDLLVYCNSFKYNKKIDSYHGAKLRYIRIEANGFKGIFYDTITFISSLFTADVILYLSPVGSGFITPLIKLFKTKVIVNHGGLNEWEREKLNGFQKKWAKVNHRIAAKYSNLNIADNELYRESLKNHFNADSIVIRYGSDHVKNISIDDLRFANKYNFTKEPYAVSVSRAQIDNNIHIVLEAFETFNKYKIVIVSNWDISEYGRRLKEKYSKHKNMILLDAIYNKEELDFIRGNASVYVHSHSRCGTAPSLVEAMSLKKAVISLDIPTNRETTKDSALYFSNTEELIAVLNKTNISDLSINSQMMAKIAKEEYTWSKIASEYKTQILNLS